MHGDIKKCAVCGKEIPADRARKITCSEECQTERRREQAREYYWRASLADPDYSRKKWAQAKKRPGFCAHQNEKKRDRRKNDPTAAELERERSRARYAANRLQILEGRRQKRAAMTPEEIELVRAKDRERYARNAEKILALRLARWTALEKAEQNLRLERKRRQDRAAYMARRAAMTPEEIELARTKERMQRAKRMERLQADPEKYQQYLERTSEKAAAKRARHALRSLWQVNAELNKKLEKSQ